MRRFSCQSFYLPLPFTENFYFIGVDNPEGNFAARGGDRAVDGLRPPADAVITRTAKRELHHDKNGINEILHSTQGEAKDAFEYQNGK